ncbi:MAG: malate synthase A, partial [Thermocrispum agreste]
MAEIQVVGPPVERGEEILTEEALGFVGHLHEPFAKRRDELLAARVQRRLEASRTGRLD